MYLLFFLSSTTSRIGISGDHQILGKRNERSCVESSPNVKPAQQASRPEFSAKDLVSQLLKRF
jgi:hypothetical protein